MTDHHDADAAEHDELSYEGFFQSVLARQPSFEPVYDAHVDEYGELLPFVLMADYARFLFAACREASTGLDLLEAAIDSDDPKLSELVSVSFLENLDQAGDVQEFVTRALRPGLRRELNRIEGTS